MTTSLRSFCRRAGGSWIETKTTTTPLGRVEEITLSTSPPTKEPPPPPKKGKP